MSTKTPITPIDQEYEYKPTWTIVMLGAIVCGGYTVLFYNDVATIFDWVVWGISLCLAIMSVLSAVQRLTLHQRIALTQDSIILPKSRWSSKEIAIKYDTITNLSTYESSGQDRFLQVCCQDGNKFKIVVPLLPSKEAFYELRWLLKKQIKSLQQDAI